jgi:hypothetical protein
MPEQKLAIVKELEANLETKRFAAAWTYGQPL